MNRAVLDAAFIGHCLLPGPQSEAALGLLASLVDGGTHLMAPPLLDAEVAALLHRQVWQRGLLPEEATAAWNAFAALDVDLTAPPGLYPAAIDLARRLQRADLYDCCYAVVAEFNNCPYWTGNRRFFIVGQVRLPNLHWLGDWPA